MTAGNRFAPAGRTPGPRPEQNMGQLTGDGEVTMAGTGIWPPALEGQPPGTAILRVLGHDVARYVWQPDVPLAMSPRPYLHPVRTLAGITVTDAGPDSHRHQFGISIAAPDVGGHNFWGGRTFVAGHGPAWLDNHGVQRHQRWLRHSADELAHVLRWADAHGTALLHEHRTITCRPLTGTAWALVTRMRLSNATGAALPIRSPAGQGRPGAGYGGFFWRGAAVDSALVLSPAGTDVRSVHGGTAAWLAVTGVARGDTWTVLFVPGDEVTARDRWFVRARDYVGVGSSLAWDEPLMLGPEATIERSLVTVVVDGPLTPVAAADLADLARQAI